MIANQEEIDANRRNPKNRFLLVFCHAGQVGDSWGYNWSFKCGAFLFSILIFILTIFDLSTLTKCIARGRSWFVFWCILRFLSDLLAVVGVIVAIFSIFQSSFKNATIAYYLVMASLFLDTIFIVYCIVSLFDRTFWQFTGWYLIVWMFNEFVLLICDWILFCNMVDTGRKMRNAMAANPF